MSVGDTPNIVAALIIKSVFKGTVSDRYCEIAGCDIPMALAKAV